MEAVEGTKFGVFRSGCLGGSTSDRLYDISAVSNETLGIVTLTLDVSDGTLCVVALTCGVAGLTLYVRSETLDVGGVTAGTIDDMSGVADDTLGIGLDRFRVGDDALGISSDISRASGDRQHHNVGCVCPQQTHQSSSDRGKRTNPNASNFPPVPKIAPRNPSMNARKPPFRRLRTKPMLHRIAMNIIAASDKIRLIPHPMLPKPALPQILLLTLAARQRCVQI